MQTNSKKNGHSSDNLSSLAEKPVEDRFYCPENTQADLILHNMNMRNVTCVRTQTSRFRPLSGSNTSYYMSISCSVVWNGNSSKCLTSHKQLFADDEVIVGVSELYDKKSYKLLTRKVKPKMTTFESFLVNKCLRTINIKF